jgi:hypothetical protein
VWRVHYKKAAQAASPSFLRMEIPLPRTRAHIFNGHSNRYFYINFTLNLYKPDARFYYLQRFLPALFSFSAQLLNSRACVSRRPIYHAVSGQFTFSFSSFFHSLFLSLFRFLTNYTSVSSIRIFGINRYSIN